MGHLYYNQSGKILIRNLKNIKIIRKRYNHNLKGPYNSQKAKIVSFDSKVIHSTGWNSITDYLYVSGYDKKGKYKEYECVLYTKKNLEKLTNFIKDALENNSENPGKGDLSISTQIDPEGSLSIIQNGEVSIIDNDINE